MRRLEVKKEITLTISPEDLETLDKAYNVAKDLFVDFCEINREYVASRYSDLDERIDDVINAISDFLLAYKRSNEE